MRESDGDQGVDTYCIYDEYQCLALRRRLVPNDDAPSEGKSTPLWRGTAGTVVRTSSQFPMQPSLDQGEQLLFTVCKKCFSAIRPALQGLRRCRLRRIDPDPSRDSLHLDRHLHNQRCLEEQRSLFVSADPEHAHRVGRHTPAKTFPTFCLCISARVWESIRQAHARKGVGAVRFPRYLGSGGALEHGLERPERREPQGGTGHRGDARGGAEERSRVGEVTVRHSCLL